MTSENHIISITHGLKVFFRCPKFEDYFLGKLKANPTVPSE